MKNSEAGPGPLHSKHVSIFLPQACLLMLQAFWRAFSSLFGGGIQFKTTLKGASMLMNSTLRDLWMPGLMFFLMLASSSTAWFSCSEVSSASAALGCSCLL